MNIFLWISQLCLAFMFLIAGIRKVFQSGAKLLSSRLYDRIPLAFIRVLGLLEISASVGITLPLLTNIYPILTIIAAVCMAIVLLGAIIVHVKKEEYKILSVIIFLFALALTVTYLRLKDV